MNRTHQDESNESSRISVAAGGRKRAEMRTNPREFALDPLTHWPVLSPLIAQAFLFSFPLWEI